MTLPELDPPAAAMWITRTLEAEGHETWAVGGALRDAILGESIGDWDFATRARPEVVQKLFPRTVPIGVEHGTVGVLARDGRLYEVTTYRKDVETDGRHAVVSFSDTIEEDLARRDFTINAIAWHVVDRRWLDPYEGRSDLESGILRTVGDPDERFREDRLRVLRGLRFAGRFGLTIDPATTGAMRRAASDLTALSAERVHEELQKVMAAPRPSVALRLYREVGVLGALYPEFDSISDLEYRVALGGVDGVRRSAPLARMTGFFLPVLKAVGPAKLGGLLDRLRFSRAEQKAVLEWGAIVADGQPEDDDLSRRRWLRRSGRENLRGVARVWAGQARGGSMGSAGGGDPVVVNTAPMEARTARMLRALRRVAGSGAALTVGELAVDGATLKELGLPPGPLFGRILERLLDRVIEDPWLNDRDTLKGLVPELVAELESTE